MKCNLSTSYIALDNKLKCIFKKIISAAIAPPLDTYYNYYILKSFFFYLLNLVYIYINIPTSISKKHPFLGWNQFSKLTNLSYIPQSIVTHQYMK